MNPLTRKIFVALFAVMLGISLVSPQVGAVDHCIGSMCSHCNLVVPPTSESVQAVGFDGHMCDSSFTTSPCSLNTYPDSNTKVFTVTSIKQDRQKTGGAITVAVFRASLVQNSTGNGKRDQSRFTFDTIPIYLQNLSLLCWSTQIILFDLIVYSLGFRFQDAVYIVFPVQP